MREHSGRHVSSDSWPRSDSAPEARVLVVDDETNIVDLLAVSLRFQGFRSAHRHDRSGGALTGPGDPGLTR